MTYHLFFERLFEKTSPSKGLLAPFDIDAICDVDTDDRYFDSTLYKTVLPPSKQNGLAYVFLIERAITRAAMPFVNPELTGFGGYGFDDKGNFYCDYYDGQQSSFNELLRNAAGGAADLSKERHIIMEIEEATGKLRGSVIDQYGGEEAYLIKTRNNDASNRHSASAAIYACLSYILARFARGDRNAVSEVMFRHFKDISDGYAMSDMATFMKAVMALDGDFYTLFQYPKEVARAYGTLPFDPSTITNPDLEKVDLGAIGELTDMVGDSKILKGEKAKASAATIRGKKKPRTIKELTADDTYDLGLVLSDAEKDLVPKSFEEFVPSEIILDVAMEIKSSSFDPVPARNFMFTGETGTGKTTETQMLARLLNIPYRSMNLSSDKLSSDILVSCLPNREKVTKDDVLKVFESFPDSETVAVNPEAAYAAVTGSLKKGATESDIRKAECDAVMGLIAKANDFMYVDSPFVETFRYGGVVELQEVNSCKAAILKSLNEALDDLNIIHLPTGEVVHRNPDCVVVITANVGQGYEGINNFSNDFIARFHQADVFELPDDDTLAERVSGRSGYTDKKTIKKMIKVMHAIQNVLLETKGDYGSCSPRGLIAWARKTKNCGNPYLAGCKTIVGLATQDPEVRIEVLHALETEFSPM